MKICHERTLGCADGLIKPGMQCGAAFNALREGTKPLSRSTMTKNESNTPPEGWVKREHPLTFSSFVGPMYFREGDEPGVGFFAEARHANLGGIVHGGMLMTLADMALFDIVFRKTGPFKAVTMTMNSEFLAPAPINAFIEASGEVLKSGRSIFFVRGLVTAHEKPLLSFSGSLKRLS
jgi:acyl-coenzyme A thioesterase PaaI-like protein